MNHLIVAICAILLAATVGFVIWKSVTKDTYCGDGGDGGDELPRVGGDVPLPPPNTANNVNDDRNVPRDGSIPSGGVINDPRTNGVRCTQQCNSNMLVTTCDDGSTASHASASCCRVECVPSRGLEQQITTCGSGNNVTVTREPQCTGRINVPVNCDSYCEGNRRVSNCDGRQENVVNERVCCSYRCGPGDMWHKYCGEEPSPQHPQDLRTVTPTDVPCGEPQPGRASDGVPMLDNVLCGSSANIPRENTPGQRHTCVQYCDSDRQTVRCEDGSWTSRQSDSCCCIRCNGGFQYRVCGSDRYVDPVTGQQRGPTRRVENIRDENGNRVACNGQPAFEHDPTDEHPGGGGGNGGGGPGVV